MMIQEKLKIRLKTVHRQLLADTITPVSIYLKVRDRFAGSILLESSDYHGQQNSYSYICCDPIASFILDKSILKTQFPEKDQVQREIQYRGEVLEALQDFSDSFETEQNLSNHDFISNGLFGYISYDAVEYFEDISLKSDNREAIPEICYKVFKYIIVVDHFKNILHLIQNSPYSDADKLDDLQALIFNRNIPSYRFNLLGEEKSNLTDEEFLEFIRKGQAHCFKGDVFQIVLSRRFDRKFEGDEFNVYRALRSINPSPYLFYFDMGSFRIFGSSPEAQIEINNGKASIYPIAGTFRRTGDDKADELLALKLLEDPKENAEHVMLVDLARNDLSRNSDEVEVESFREIQFYSHVIHLVSKVSAKVAPEDGLKIVAETFPAGTLTGAPKHKAMQLIDQYEKDKRGFYGGAIGYLGFNGDFNHAIMIRSFLSKDNELSFQAGAGIVAASDIKSESQEVHNKLEALRKALKMAVEI